METRYHGYPQPDLATSEIMRRLAYGELVLAHMEDTFEPVLIDVSGNKRYAVPEEVDKFTSLICRENIRYRSMMAKRNVK